MGGGDIMINKLSKIKAKRVFVGSIEVFKSYEFKLLGLLREKKLDQKLRGAPKPSLIAGNTSKMFDNEIFNQMKFMNYLSKISLAMSVDIAPFYSFI